MADLKSMASFLGLVAKATPTGSCRRRILCRRSALNVPGRRPHKEGGLTVPIGDADWLAQTQEATLEPDLLICDSHHHFWVQRPEPPAYQRYLLADLAADINSGHNVRSTVFIEARSEYRTEGPEELRPVGEVEFVQKLADESATGAYGPARAAAAIIGPG